MDRATARTFAQTVLEALGLFQSVVQGPSDSFGGASPVAVITSRSMRLDDVARELYTVDNGISVSIYVRRDPDPVGAEAKLDDLTLAAMVALHITGAFDIGESNADPAGGYQRVIDGVVYRIERIPLSVLDEGGT